MEATEQILIQPVENAEIEADVFASQRQPFSHPSLDSVDNLTTTHPRDVLDYSKLAKLASETGLSAVVRWKPRLVCAFVPMTFQ